MQAAQLRLWARASARLFVSRTAGRYLFGFAARCCSGPKLCLLLLYLGFVYLDKVCNVPKKQIHLVSCSKANCPSLCFHLLCTQKIHTATTLTSGYEKQIASHSKWTWRYVFAHVYLSLGRTSTPAALLGGFRACSM